MVPYWLLSLLSLSALTVGVPSAKAPHSLLTSPLVFNGGAPV